MLRRVRTVTRFAKLAVVRHTNLHTSSVFLRQRHDLKPFAPFVNAETIDVVCRKKFSRTNRAEFADDPIFSDHEKGVPTLPSPPPPGVRQHIFVDANIINHYMTGQFPLLNAYLQHPAHICYYTPTVAAEVHSLTPDPAIFRYFESPDADAPVEIMIDLINQKMRNESERRMAASLENDLKIIGEVAISVPGEFRPGQDDIPFLLTANMTLFRGFLVREYLARVVGWAIELAGLDHMKDIVWAQDIGVRYRGDYSRIIYELTEGKYAASGVDLNSQKGTFKSFFDFMEKEKRLPPDIDPHLPTNLL